MRRRRILLLIGLFCIILSTGTVGYELIEGWSIHDSLYMTVITLSTVGFGEVHPLSEAGRTFTALLIIMGIATLTYTSSALINDIFKYSLEDRRVHRMNKRIAKLSNHAVVLGFGRMGKKCLQGAS